MTDDSVNVEKSKKTLLLVGASSGLARSFQRFIEELDDFHITTTSRNGDNDIGLQLDNSVFPEFRDSFDVVIVFAGMTNMSECETSPELADLVNCDGVVKLMESVQAKQWVVFSTNLVLAGDTPNKQGSDAYQPFNRYGASKAKMEQALLRRKESVAIIRLTKVIQPELPIFVGFLTKLVEKRAIQAFDDMTISPIWIDDVSLFLVKLVSDFSPGIYQLSGSSDVSYYQVMQYFAKQLKLKDSLIQPMAKAVKSPKYTSLHVDIKENRYGFTALPYSQVLNKFLNSADLKKEPYGYINGCRLREKVMVSKHKNRRVFISGIFNVLHPGHVRLFRFASELADEVIVGVHSKTANELHMLDDDERVEALKCISLVNRTILVSDLNEALNDLKPDFVLKGSEFKNKLNPEQETISAWGGKLVFSSGESQFNVENYLGSNKLVTSLDFPGSYKNYIRRHNITSPPIKNAFNNISKMRVAVIGDIILDEYVDCDPVGLSREDPTIVVTPTAENMFVGGAAIVALHTRSFGAKVDFFSLSGRDKGGDWLETKLAGSDISTYIYKDDSRPTTVKKRYRTQNKTLLRVNEFRSHSMESALQKKLIADFEANVDEYDLIVFSDFSYGLLNLQMVKTLQKIASRHNVPMVADSQTSSQRGDLSKFSGLSLATPTEIEARLAVDIHDNDVGLAVVIEEVARKLDAENLAITLGADGVLLLDFSDKENPRLDSLPALNKQPLDVSGAGDLLLVSSSLLKQAGCDLWHASLVGMLAAAIHISRIGNTPIEQQEILSYIDRI